VFEDLVHEDDQLSHDGGEGDFGGFTRRPESLVKRFELMVAVCSDQCRHVERASNGGPASTDGSATLPTSAFTRMWRQASQRSRLSTIERAQLWQLGKDAQGGHGTHAGDGFEFLGALVQLGGLGAEFFELRFDLF
jgi:hypothetical protein